jgi:hypothetical protein
MTLAQLKDRCDALDLSYGKKPTKALLASILNAFDAENNPEA